ncbi:MAG: long-chain fatty acid--CoA ligase [Ectothiorhodospiraceae bacterium]|nr:long-chain fatty acid--CoA ligase [Ectothiorhodospiraceae bacterium]
MFDRHLHVWPPHAPRELTLPETSLYANLSASAERYPDTAAIIYYGRKLPFRDLKTQVDHMAGHLQQQGVQTGDRVLLYMQNCPQFVIGFYAILRANAVVVPVNPMNRHAELDYLIQDTGARVALTSQDVYPNLVSFLENGLLRHAVVATYLDYADPATDLSLPDVVSEPRLAGLGNGALFWAEALASAKQPGPHTVGPDDTCVIPYSSGTTSNPKGCVHTHRSAMATTVIGSLWTIVDHDAVQLVTVPMFHVTGMQVCMNNSIYAGCPMIIMTRWDRFTAAELIQRYRVTNWRNIPTMVIDMLADDQIERYDLSSLEAIGGGGAAMPRAIAGKLYDMAGLRYIEGYGLSETMATTHANPPHAPKAQCLGIPVIGVDSRIIDLETGEELGPNASGEILIHGAQVFQGYWNRPEETEAAFIELDGKRFFRTGDIGYYDEEGYFFLVDRVKRMINAAGFKVWPTEVESLMYGHPAIQEVCIISTPHARRGETVKAVIVLRPEFAGRVSENEIIDWCKNNMSAYKVPKLVEFRKELPRSPTGKLMWRHVQDEENQAVGRASGDT